MFKPRKDYSCEIGKEYGRLKILDVEWKKEGNRFRPHAIFLCKCGKTKSSNIHLIRKGRVVSCGCKRSEGVEGIKTHGMTGNRMYKILDGMKHRCYNHKNIGYHRYGGRGIKICDEWLSDFTKFYNWAMNNGYRDDLTIERINNDGNYEPSNCKWATREEQNKNRDLTNVIENKKRAIIQFDLLTKEKIKEFDSIKSAIQETGLSSIPYCLSGKCKRAGNYYWEYKNKN